MAGVATSQRTAAVPAKAPGNARLEVTISRDLWSNSSITACRENFIGFYQMIDLS